MRPELRHSGVAWRLWQKCMFSCGWVLKYPVMWKHIFMANKQVAPLGCSAGSIAGYVTGAAAQRGGLEIVAEMYVFM